MLANRLRGLALILGLGLAWQAPAPARAKVLSLTPDEALMTARANSSVTLSEGSVLGDWATHHAAFLNGATLVEGGAHSVETGAARAGQPAPAL